MSQPRPDLPVPLRAWTVSPSVQDAQATPGERREQHRGKLPRARSTPHPADAIEEYPRRVEHEETDVEDLVHAVTRRRPGGYPRTIYWDAISPVGVRSTAISLPRDAPRSGSTTPWRCGPRSLPAGATGCNRWSLRGS